MDYSPAGSSVNSIFQAKILEWIAISFSRVSSLPRDQTQVSYTAGRFFTDWATRLFTFICCDRQSLKIPLLEDRKLNEIILWVSFYWYYPSQDINLGGIAFLN